MDFRDIVRSGLDRYLDGLKNALDGLTPAELRWQPSPNANHISWLAWHMARVEDHSFNTWLAQTEQLWVSGEWAERFGLAPERSGYGDSAEDIAAFPEIPVHDLLAYFDAVRPSALAVVDGLTREGLASTVADTPIQPPPTVAALVALILNEQGQHLGQVAYIRGLLRGLDG